MKKLKIFLLSLVVVLAIPNISATHVSAANKNLVVHYIDIGQGDAIYIKTPKGDDIIIDAGNKSKGDDVVKYLKKQKVDDIEVMIATHPDADHVGGLDEVLAAYRVENIYAPKVSHTTQAYKDFLQAVKREKKTIKTAKNGVALAIKDKSIKAKFIGPVKDYSKSDLNNWSAVVHIQYNKNSFLFTGDAELKSEKDMLSKKLLSKVNVLKVGHHGSKDSSSKDFLNKVKPTYAVISVGKGNRYKHPTSETLNRLKAVKAKVYRTDKNGTVKITSSGTKISVSPAKK
ncbi:ComEC/Rec2 family competence protein [Bacillus gobiensis]|uniref:ComEC/Rec2 family competence protein n=1 Tax=Bacillus gobiensis TaxID=1441095 RepID=UPI003D1BD709